LTLKKCENLKVENAIFLVVALLTSGINSFYINLSQFLKVNIPPDNLNFVNEICHNTSITTY